jgi:hypothetical protein
MSRFSGIAGKLALVAAGLAVLPVVADAKRIARPPVPGDLQPPAGHEPYLVGHAVGTQNYVCLVSPTGAQTWAPFGPQATLFDDRGVQIATHFASLNPEEVETARPTWQHSKDTSAVWAKPGVPFSDPEWVEEGAVPWLLLEVKGTRAGTQGVNRFAGTTYIQRVRTSGGIAPTRGCNEGDKAFVPYTTDYYFYRFAE